MTARSCAAANVNLLLENEATLNHNDFFDDRDDQHAILFTYIGHVLHNAPDSNALYVGMLADQRFINGDIAQARDSRYFDLAGDDGFYRDVELFLVQRNDLLINLASGCVSCR